jgi:hypothetical protein
MKNNVIPFDRPRKCWLCGARGPVVIVPTVISSMALCPFCEAETANLRASALSEYAYQSPAPEEHLYV